MLSLLSFDHVDDKYRRGMTFDTYVFSVKLYTIIVRSFTIVELQ